MKVKDLLNMLCNITDAEDKEIVFIAPDGTSVLDINECFTDKEKNRYIFEMYKKTT